MKRSIFPYFAGFGVLVGLILLAVRSTRATASDSTATDPPPTESWWLGSHDPLANHFPFGEFDSWLLDTNTTTPRQIGSRHELMLEAMQASPEFSISTPFTWTSHTLALDELLLHPLLPETHNPLFFRPTLNFPTPLHLPVPSSNSRKTET